MRNLCLVSRHLRQVVEPILSQEFMLGHGEPRWYRHYTWDRRLTAFMRTVAHRRDPASLVKQIYIHPHLIRDFGYAQFYGTDYSEKRAKYPPRGCTGTRARRPTLSFRRRSTGWLDDRSPKFGTSQPAYRSTCPFNPRLCRAPRRPSLPTAYRNNRHLLWSFAVLYRRLLRLDEDARDLWAA
jgi:hypothetical protein